ncbi:hypothetical protein GOP47_0013669 [Adiantum capillus-veneris]|uniref:Uncharacterized protein n=1 Tax=Adiantum capillus-veneris TaxID=13818 RepID=A0A9D4UQ69_ADICA|nr:hypothetical protein GOP47_0013669 [Adiantum capillus-veneris]
MLLSKGSVLISSHGRSCVSFPLVSPQQKSAQDPAHTVPGVVITGGSRGLGFALAHEFLARGARVSICGRNEGRLRAASEALQREHPHCSLSFIPCDVSIPQDVARFALFSEETLQGNIHFWINNAGEVTSKKILTDIEPEEIVRVSNTNVIGSILCCREAMRIMTQQPPSSFPVYHIFNMGFSRWGAKFTKSACTHKATKIALTQLTESLNEELKNAGITSIGVHNLSPGMVLTDLLLKDSTPVARRFFNVLAEEPETVAAALVPRILDVQGSGKSIEYLSPIIALTKVLVGFPQILQGGRFFDDKGDRVKEDGCQYQDNGVRMLF